MSRGRVIAIIDGEHHPSAVRDSLDRIDGERGLAGVVFAGGEEKVPRAVLDSPEDHYGRAIEKDGVDAALRALAAAGADVVVDLADEPILPAAAKLRLASLALHLGLDYEAPGLRLAAPRYAPVEFAGRKLAVIGTGKRIGKTAVTGHLASLLAARGARPVIVSMGRGGPAEPQLAPPHAGLDQLVGIAAAGRHAASDYLEHALLTGLPAVGCRRVGGGPAGEPFESNVADGAALAASLDAGTLIFDGSGACIPPVEVDCTICVVGERSTALNELGSYRLLRADLALVMNDDGHLLATAAELCGGPALRCELRPEPTEGIPPDARVAMFSTGRGVCEGLEPILSSDNLARRSALAADLDRAAAERCDIYLVELKAAAIDTVVERARRKGARVIFLRNRPVALDGDLDAALIELHESSGPGHDA